MALRVNSRKAHGRDSGSVLVLDTALHNCVLENNDQGTLDFWEDERNRKSGEKVCGSLPGK